MRARLTGGDETINVLPLARALAFLLLSPLAARGFLAPKLGFSTTC